MLKINTFFRVNEKSYSIEKLHEVITERVKQLLINNIKEKLENNIKERLAEDISEDTTITITIEFSDEKIVAKISGDEHVLSKLREKI